MYCTFAEATKCLGFKSRSSLYQLKKKGVLKPYLEFINEQKYLYMGSINGVTLAKHIEHNLTSNNWITINDFDPELFVELTK